jgi:hypothetical protein
MSNTAHKYRNPTKDRSVTYPSVTTVLRSVAKPGISNWDKRQTAIAATNIPRIEWPTDPDECVKWLMEASKRELKKSAARGTTLHKVAEDFMNGAALPDDLEPEDMARVTVLARFIERYAPKVIASEQRLLNTQYGYGGTGDLIATTRCVPGAPIMWDYKSAKALYSSFGMQLAAYAKADLMLFPVDGVEDCRSEPMPELSPVGLVVLITPTHYEVGQYDLAEEFKGFLAALTLHKRPYRTFVQHKIISEQIYGAATLEDLYEIYARQLYAGQWTDELTAAAAVRKAQFPVVSDTDTVTAEIKNPNEKSAK